jgi:transcriptional regulator with XRE-family HTH domain
MAQKRPEKRGNGLKSQLRKAIRESGQSLQQLGRECGVGADRLSRFLNGKRGLSLDAAEKLCDTLGLRLVGKSRPRQAPKVGKEEE